MATTYALGGTTRCHARRRDALAHGGGVSCGLMKELKQEDSVMTYLLLCFHIPFSWDPESADRPQVD